MAPSNRGSSGSDLRAWHHVACTASAVLCLSMAACPVDAAERGVASVYAKKFHGKRTASGQRFSLSDLSAAHRRLPFGTKVRVTNRSNSKSVIVRINDRGPFVRGRVIDLTPAGARALGFSGLASVRLERL